MTWDEAYQRWHEASLAHRNTEAYEHLEAARKRVAANTAEDWVWLRAALADAEKKWFVAWVFKRQPIPRRLFSAMMQAAVVDVNASTNKWLITPCVETFGTDMVVAELERLRDAGLVSKDRFDNALYWVRRDTDFTRATRPENG